MIRPPFPFKFQVVALVLTLSTAIAAGPVATHPRAGAPCVQSFEQHSSDQTRLTVDDPEVGRTGWRGSTVCVSESACIHGNAQGPCKQDTPKPVYWFSFGDSYTETGFNASRALPSIGNPLGNPRYPGSTAGGGENWVDYLTTTYNNSLVLTYNFAWGGATIDPRMVPPGQGISLTDEVNTFLRKFSQKPQSTPWQTRNTLFSVWIGINDIAYTYNHGGDRHAFSDKLLDSYFALVEKLYDSGARFFLFITVPPVDRSPVMLARPVWEQAIKKAVILGYNSKLQKRIDWFERNHSDVTVWRWDSHALFTAILDNPSKYGFRDATSHGRGSAHFWSNAYHPGSSGHKIFAQEIRGLLGDAPW